jgi:8-oxo-dGTP pyrophosphatase MutT (NUDIX family)
MLPFYQKKQPNACSNCGLSGHSFKQCEEPVSSYGVLVFRWISSTDKWPQVTELCKNVSDLKSIENLIPQVLMIQRKDSLGFMDIMRGKYKLNEPEYLKKQLRGITEKEREKLRSMEFDQIWSELWGEDLELNQRYANDRKISRQKLSELREGVELEDGTKYTIHDLLRQEPVVYTTPEWGFPKGRRDPHESDIKCAYRELQEETSIHEDELLKVINVSPFIEQFYGSNGVHYRHTYYIAQYVGSRTICFNALNQEMAREIGNLSWKPFDEANSLIRPENLEKRKLLNQLTALLQNYIPVLSNTYVKFVVL